MDHLDALQEALVGLLPADARHALAAIQLRPLEPGTLDQSLARLAHHVPPAYLPFATFEGSPLAIHLRPGVDVSQAPVVFISQGSRTPKFVCGQFSDLARGAWLWVGGYFKSRVGTLREATEKLAVSLGGRPIPPVLWDILTEAPDYEPTWWSFDASEYTSRAWLAADVGHPFALAGKIDPDDARAALEQMNDQMGSRVHAAPELVAARIAAQVAANVDPDPRSIVEVLSAEAWLGGAKVLQGRWSPIEHGLSEWSMVLKIALKAPGSLQSSAFAGLVEHPETYSGADPSGPNLLVDVARRLTEAGDHQGAVAQLRNAAFVSLFTRHRYGDHLCNEIAQACDRVASGSLAATLARAAATIGLDEA